MKTTTKLIALGTVGSDYVDVAAATAKGIPVTNVPDTFIEEVADHAIVRDGERLLLVTLEGARTPVENLAQSSLRFESFTLVESIRRTASLSLRRRPRVAMPSMCMKRPENTSGLRLRLASAKVERAGGRPPA